MERPSGPPRDLRRAHDAIAAVRERVRGGVRDGVLPARFSAEEVADAVRAGSRAEFLGRVSRHLGDGGHGGVLPRAHPGVL
eukprot:31058-Pelagococcus_subviridis.AAC.18